MKQICFIDTEVSEADNKAYDFGAVDENDDKLHTGSAHEFNSFIAGGEFLCCHNIIDHDAKYIEVPENAKLIDTLYLSPLLFPNKPYHRLLKNDKLLTDELNNPLNDAAKAKELFYDEVNAFMALDDELKLIQQVWKAIKDLTHIRPEVCCSPLEVARQAGWDDSVADIETRVKTAIQALENAGYIKRGKNAPRVYADGILVKSMIEAAERIDSSSRFENDEERTIAKRIISSLISKKSISKAGNAEAESRVDYLADRLGIDKTDVIRSVQQMREAGILADSKDQKAYIQKTDTVNKSMLVLHRFQALETFLLDYIDADKFCTNYKELNEAALAGGVKTSSVNSIKTFFYYWTIRSYIQKEQDQATNRVIIVSKLSMERIKSKRQNSYSIAEFIINYLFKISSEEINNKEEVLVDFSIMELMNAYNEQSLFKVTANDINEALLFLSKIGAMKLEGGFSVGYSGMRIQRLELDNRIKYKQEDYKQLNEFYQQKIQQIHIVGEYANSKYLRSFITEHDAKQYSLIDNYRSCRSIVSFANQFVKTISERMKTEDIIAVKENEGQVKLIKHSGADMETALVEDVLSVNAKGTTCILTNTNREALLVLGVLKQKNIPAKLIQSIDGFDMYDIAEIRYFLKKLNIENSSPVISNEQWNTAVEALQKRYQGSNSISRQAINYSLSFSSPKSATRISRSSLNQVISHMMQLSALFVPGRIRKIPKKLKKQLLFLLTFISEGIHNNVTRRRLYGKRDQ